MKSGGSRECKRCTPRLHIRKTFTKSMSAHVVSKLTTGYISRATVQYSTVRMHWEESQQLPRVCDRFKTHDRIRRLSSRSAFQGHSSNRTKTPYQSRWSSSLLRNGTQRSKCRHRQRGRPEARISSCCGRWPTAVESSKSLVLAGGQKRRYTYHHGGGR